MANDQFRDERLQIMLTGEELTALDDFRFRRRMPTRAAAIREWRKASRPLPLVPSQKIMASLALTLKGAKANKQHRLVREGAALPRIK